MSVYELVPRFRALFAGYDQAFGTGKGGWIKRPPRAEDFVDHLQGKGSGIGIAPLCPDNHVRFAAIDLDEPDFDAALEMQKYIPGTSWIERSRSGNAHIWVFFERPCVAWLAMGVLREATLAAGKKSVEVFPKNHDFARVRVGNYINLPYHGAARPIVDYDPQRSSDRSGQWAEYRLEKFVKQAEATRNDPAAWEKAARWMTTVGPPAERENQAEFGTQAHLHTCADRIITGAAGTIGEGHRNAVLFMLARCLCNWEQTDHDETLQILRSVNEDLFRPPEDDYELRRILRNCEENQYTSTGCDDPLILPFADPNCPIANPRRA